MSKSWYCGGCNCITAVTWSLNYLCWHTLHIYILSFWMQHGETLVSSLAMFSLIFLLFHLFKVVLRDLLFTSYALFVFYQLFVIMAFAMSSLLHSFTLLCFICMVFSILSPLLLCFFILLFVICMVLRIMLSELHSFFFFTLLHLYGIWDLVIVVT